MAGTLEEIDSSMEHIWLKVVKKDYDRSRILEESNLHSTVYFHLEARRGFGVTFSYVMNFFEE